MTWSDPIAMTKTARQDTEYALESLPEQLRRIPLSWSLHEQLARAKRALGIADWETDARNAIDLLSDDVVHHDHQPSEFFQVGLFYLMADLAEPALTHLEQFVSRTEAQRARRPVGQLDFDYFVALILLGDLDRVTEVSSSLDRSHYRRSSLVFEIIDADRAGDRRSRDAAATSFLDQPGRTRSEFLWYPALSSLMVAKGRFKKDSHLPTLPIDQSADAEYRQYKEQFGEKEAVTQLRAAQSGNPVDTEIIARHANAAAAKLQSDVLPPHHELMMLAGLHRLLGDTNASQDILGRLVEDSTANANLKASALLIFNRDSELFAFVEGHQPTGPTDQINDYVNAYLQIATHSEEESKARADLQRWAKKLSPAASHIELRPREVEQLVIERFGAVS